MHTHPALLYFGARGVGPKRASFVLALGVVLSLIVPGALGSLGDLGGGVARAEDAPLRFAPDRPVDVTRLALDLEVDLVERAIAGIATIELKAVIVPLEEVTLDAVDLLIDDVTDGEGRALAHRATGERLVVRLAEAIRARGQGVTLLVRYRARPKRGLHFFGPTASEPEVPWQVWSQNEAEDARHWIPCIDHPEERQVTSVRATVASGLQVLSNGALLAREATDDGRERWSYAESFEHPIYLVTLVVGRFDVVRDAWEDVPIAYWVPPGRAGVAKRSFGTTKAMLAFFSERFGVRYPYGKYDQVVVEQFIFGGMENTGATTLNDFALLEPRALYDGSAEWLVAHELGHQWFGNLVTCRDWGHIWLNEGFASYCEALWEEHQSGVDGYDEVLLSKLGGALGGGRQAPLVRRRYRAAGDTFGGGTYPKGAWVAHLLRRELGDEDFFAGIQAYLTAHRAAPVETEDLRRALERVSGRSLGHFFHQWTERAGHPVVQVRARWREAEGLLEVVARQKQEGEPFAFTLEVALELGAAGGADGAGSAVGGAAKRSIPLVLADKEARLLVPLAARPLRVAIDPGLSVLVELELDIERDLLLASLARGERVAERWRAARALAGADHPSVLDALALAIAADPSASVRHEAVRALAKVPDEGALVRLLAALDALIEETGRPLAIPDVRGAERPEALERARIAASTRRALVDALADRAREARVGEALAALAPREPSDGVRAAIARALGGAKGEASLAALVDLAAEHTPLERVRTAALRALTEREEALAGLPIARAYAAAPTPWRLRSTAIDALGRYAARDDVDETTREALVVDLAAMLEDPAPRFRRDAAHALRAVGAGAHRSLAVLDALARGDPDLGVREAAKRAAEATRKGEARDESVRRLRGEVERADEERRRLVERLERLEARLGAGAPSGRRGEPW